jgi:lysophospholipid acyltransferase (LPLAT)-like uncharacterized protein
MSLLKRLTTSRPVQKVLGVTAAEYLRLVWKTTRITREPVDSYERAMKDAPIILAFWHGQHFLTPFVRRPEDRAKVLVSRHRDGEMNAIAAEHLGVGAVRGSGDHSGRFLAKGGASGFIDMMNALAQGYNVAMTADIPKIARVASLGVVKLAALSGRPICPIALATKRRIELKNWDRTAINLPFGPGSWVTAESIHVPADADHLALEAARQNLESALNAITARAYAMLDGH